MGVIDQLEPVNVDEGDRDGLVLSLGHPQQALEHLDRLTAVRKPGEAVGFRQSSVQPHPLKPAADARHHLRTRERFTEEVISASVKHGTDRLRVRARSEEDNRETRPP